MASNNLCLLTFAIVLLLSNKRGIMPSKIKNLVEVAEVRDLMSTLRPTTPEIKCFKESAIISFYKKHLVLMLSPIRRNVKIEKLTKDIELLLSSKFDKSIEVDVKKYEAPICGSPPYSI